MDFALSDEHSDLQRMLRSFFEREAPNHVINELDRTETYPGELYGKMADLGLCAMTIPEEYGGNPADELSNCIVAEEMSRAGACLVYAYIPTVTGVAVSLLHSGTEEQRRQHLPEIAAGRTRFALAFSEPQAGSDLSHLKTRARRDGGDWIVNGQKVFTTGADTAEFLFAFVRTDPAAEGHRGLSVFIIPTATPGITVRALRKLAGQGTHTCEVFLDDVRVPQDALVGELNHGARVTYGMLDGERISGGAQACGIAQGAYDVAFAHALDREQFGQPIADFQAIGHMLVDMHTEIEMARLLVHRAAWKKQNGIPCATDGSMAKVAASAMSIRVVQKAMQVLGGYSYMVEYPLERYWREVKLNEISGGTSQIQRNIVLKSLRAHAPR